MELLFAVLMGGWGVRGYSWNRTELVHGNYRQSMQSETNM